MRKFLLSALAILVAMGVMGSSFAYFSDVETSTGNTFEAGTLDLKTKDPNTGNWVDGVTATWTLSNMAPDSPEKYGQVELKNLGTIPADHLEISCSYTVDDDPDVESDTDKTTWQHPERFARYMEITTMRCTNDTWWFDLLSGQKYIGAYPDTSNPDGSAQNKWKVEDQESSGQPGYGLISLYDLKQDPIDDLTPPDGATQFEMKLKLHSSADNGIQGDTLDVTMFFILNQ